MTETMRVKRFVLTEEHIKLLRRMEVGWQDAETGAPEIDPKRPYGNSYVERDVLEILGLDHATMTVGGVTVAMDLPDDDDLPAELMERARKLHRETETALQIVLRTGSFEPGTYQDPGFTDWEKVR